MSRPDTVYNYTTFRPGPYVDGGCDGPEEGDYFGDFPVYELDGTMRRISELVDGVTVIETGSTTCPLYCAQIEPMREVAGRHPDVRFVMLYTREAHPGGRRGAHVDLDDKLAEARRVDASAGEWREVWVDSIDGALHTKLTGSPNSVTVLDGEARVKAWLHDSSAPAVDRVLEDVVGGLAVGDVSFSFRPPGPKAIAALFRGGPKAVWDFLLGLPTLVSYRFSGGANC